MRKNISALSVGAGSFIVLLCAGCHSVNDGPRYVTPPTQAEIDAAKQNQIQAVQNNPNMSPAQKQYAIAMYNWKGPGHPLPASGPGTSSVPSGPPGAAGPTAGQ